MEWVCVGASEMSDPKPPPGFYPVEEPPPPLGFKPVESDDGLGDADSPIRKALAASPDADVVTVETPTGPASMDRKGRRHFTAEEATAQHERLQKGGEIALGKRVLSFVNSAGLNLAPYARGVSGAVSRQLDPTTAKESLIQSFRKSKNDAQATVDDADEEAGVGYQLAGKVPSMLGGPATAAGRIVLNAGMAGVEGLTRSQGNVEDEGGLSQITRDTGFATGAGGLFAAGGEAVGAGLGVAGRYFGNKSAVNASKAAAEDILAQTQKGRSLVSSAGGAGGEVSRAVKAVREALEDPAATAAERVMAQRIAASPEYAAAVSRQRLNAMGKFFSSASDADQFAAAGAEALTDVAGKAAPVTAARFGSPIRDQAAKAFKSVAPRVAMGAAGAGIGHLTGNEHGDAIGGVMGMAMGQGGIQMLRNAAKNPVLMSTIQSGMADVFGGAAGMSRTGASMAGRQLPLPPQVNSAVAPQQKTKDQRDEEAIQAWLDAN